MYVCVCVCVCVCMREWTIAMHRRTASFMECAGKEVGSGEPRLRQVDVHFLRVCAYFCRQFERLVTSLWLWPELRVIYKYQDYA